MLKIEKLSIAYGRTQVVWDVSFAVEEKSITAILGANCSGKSSILNSIIGLIEPKNGAIFLDGDDITDYEPYRRIEAGLSIVPERRMLFPDLTVKENLELGAYNKRARLDSPRTMEEVFTLFPILRERCNQRAGTLSGGQQQMAAIGRALMAKPKLLLIDELSLGLAPIITMELFKLLKKINGAGVTILIVEQNVHQTLRIADYIFVLEAGKITLKGTTNELRGNEYIKKAYLAL
jgi:branched-chain amino acid transport system ATP-binding protein